MTITATPNPSATPPSCTVDVSVTTGHVMSSVAVYRNDSNGRTLLRTQPSAGFDSRTVTDYECPYEQSVTYDWTATSSDPSAASTVFNETWASTASWTNGAGSWNVSGGKLRNTGTSLNVLYRSVTNDKYRVTVSSFDGGTTGTTIYMGSYFTSTLSGAGVFVRVTETGTLYFGDSAGSGLLVPTAISPSSPFIIDFNATTVTISGTGGSATLPLARKFQAVVIQGTGNNANSSNIGAIKVESYASSTDTVETSSPITLDPDDAWLVHPGSTSLSVSLSDTDQQAASIVEISPVQNVSNATVHKILGSSTPVPTTTGPRSDDNTTIRIATMTAAESASVRALLASDVPILIQIPPSWGLGFNSGFYQVGDTSVENPYDFYSTRRVVTMPLQKVQSPVVDVENAGWSYAAAAVEFTAYSDLLTNFDTYADLAANTRV